MTIEALQAAREAVAAAARACEAVKLELRAEYYSGSILDDVFPRLDRVLAAKIENEEHRALPIKIGDNVTVRRRNGGPHDNTPERLVRVARSKFYTAKVRGEHGYRLEDGVITDAWENHEVHPDDLFRIKRDLVKAKK